jgi:uncharacterized protein DUF4129
MRLTGPFSRPDGLRQVQVGLALALEAGWLFAWSAAIGAIDAADPRPLIGPAALLGLLVTANLVTRLIARLRRGAALARLALALLGLLLALLLGANALLGASWPANWPGLWLLVRTSEYGLRAFIVVGLALLVWWRGLLVGRANPSLDTAEGGLRLASGALALLFLLQVFAPRNDQVLARLGGAVLLALASGLLGLPLAAVQDQHQRARYAGAPRPAIGGPWLGLLLGGIAALLLAALLLAQWLTFERLDLLLVPLGQLLGTVISTAVYLIALPIGYLVAGLVWLLRLLIHPSGPAQLPTPNDLSWLEDLRNQAERPDQAENPLLPALTLLAGSLLAAGLVWLLARAARRLADWRANDDVEELHDFVWTWATPRTQLLDRLRSLFQRPSPLAATPLHPTPNTPADQVRALYRRLLQLGAHRGRRRTASQTPDEYERALQAVGLFTAARAQLHLLTQLYTQVRYGAAQPSPTVLDAAESALDQLESSSHPSSPPPGSG